MLGTGPQKANTAGANAEANAEAKAEANAEPEAAEPKANAHEAETVSAPDLAPPAPPPKEPAALPRQPSDDGPFGKPLDEQDDLVNMNLRESSFPSPFGSADGPPLEQASLGGRRISWGPFAGPSALNSSNKLNTSTTSGTSSVAGLHRSIKGNPLTAQVSDATDGLPELHNSFECLPSVSRSLQLPATQEEQPF